jgi:FkbM family methyltransferase
MAPIQTSHAREAMPDRDWPTMRVGYAVTRTGAAPVRSGRRSVLEGLKPRYWRMRERYAAVMADLRRNPPNKRLSASIQAHLHRVVVLDGVRVRLSPRMGNDAIGFMISGDYEHPERRTLAYALSPGDRVLELGTGIGYLSTYCARVVGSGNVHTYEANPLLRPLIDETYALNGVSPKVEICMLGESAGQAEFHLTKSFWSSSPIQSRKSVRTLTVTVQPFNEAVRDFRPSFLIVDIEGGELDLMRYADLRGIDKLCIELHPYVIGPEKVRWVVERILAQGFVEIDAVSDDEHKLFLRRS